jgi:hypothetical protein
MSKEKFNSVWEESDKVLELENGAVNHGGLGEENLENVDNPGKPKYLIEGDGMDVAITYTQNVDSGAHHWIYNEPAAAVHQYGEPSEQDQELLQTLEEYSVGQHGGVEDLIFSTKLEDSVIEH